MVHRVIVEDQSLRWYGRPPKIADNSVEFVQLQFHLPEEWASLLLVAQFTQSETYNMLITEDVCFLPVELKPGLCQVSLFGYSEGKPLRATSIPLVFQIEESGFVSSAETPIPPTPDLYAQLIEYFSSISGTGGVADPAEIQKIVMEYLVANPPQVQETDPTVPEWAKYPTKPSYTAAEVGAQPAGNYLTEIEIKPVIEAANSAQALAKQADKKVDTLREVVSKFHSNIVEEAKGDIITLDDASDMELAGLTLYGKTTQNGTPTPESPVELESVGADGNVAVTVCGNNVLDAQKMSVVKNKSLEVSEDGYTITCVGGSDKTYAYSEYKLPLDIARGKTLYAVYDSLSQSVNLSTMGAPISVIVTKGDGKKAYYGPTVAGAPDEFSVPIDAQDVAICVYTNNSSSRLDSDNTVVVKGLMVSFKADAEYEPYKEIQTLTALTPNGLPGIPVSSGGNYTDENGQQWICDEIDFVRGKYVQRVKTVSVDGSKDFSKSGAGASIFVFAFNDGLVTDVSYHSPYCSHYKYQAAVDGAKLNNNCFQIGVSSAPWNAMRFRDDRFSTVDAVKTHLSNNPFELQYILAEPIETDLAAEEISAYATLHTNKPNTTVYNDSGAGMGLEYVADTKLYIDKKFAELASAIVNNV